MSDEMINKMNSVIKKEINLSKSWEEFEKWQKEFDIYTREKFKGEFTKHGEKITDLIKSV